MRVTDILFVGLLKPEPRHVDTTYCPAEVHKVLDDRGRSMHGVENELTGKKSMTGHSELDLRKIAVDNFDYRPLQKTRLVRYCGIPAHAVQVVDSAAEYWPVVQTVHAVDGSVSPSC